MNVLLFMLKVVKPFRTYIFITILIMLYYAVYISLRPYLIKLIVNAAAVPNIEQGLQALWTLIPIFACVQVSVTLVWRLHDWCVMQYEPSLKNYIGEVCFDHLSQQDNRFFQNHMVGGLSSKINDLVRGIPAMLLTMTNAYLTNIFCLVVASFFLWHIHTYLVMLMMGFIVLVVSFSIGIVKRSNNLVKGVAEESSNVMGHVVDMLTNMLNIRLFASKSDEMKRLKSVQTRYLKAARTRLRTMLRFYLMQGLCFSFYQITSIVLLIHLYQHGSVTPGDFAMVFALNLGVVDNLWRMLGDMQIFTENFGSVQQALSLIMTPLELQDLPGAKALVVKKGAIHFHNVHFCYKNCTPLFQNKSITITPDEKVGLVGYSGGGKSTFVSLILRLYEVTSGEILIDGQNIQTVTQDSLRRAIATIPQDPALFHRTVMENIRYGRPDASDEEVYAAAKKAYAHEFIIKLPSGYDALVGERGVKLSGGQRQRIAIARAILKNAPILILDEATSQLDSITEAKIQSSLLLLMQGKTTIVIAHRLSTLLHMDRILVFDQGAIIEDGTHHQLLKKKGLYKKLWDEQIGGFLPSTEHRS